MMYFISVLSRDYCNVGCNLLAFQVGVITVYEIVLHISFSILLFFEWKRPVSGFVTNRVSDDYKTRCKRCPFAL